MLISHKIRQYRALLGFAHPGEILWSSEQVEKVAPSREYGGGFMHQILIGSPWGLGIGLLEQSCDPSLVVPLELRLPGGYPHPSWQLAPSIVIAANFFMEWLLLTKVQHSWKLNEKENILFFHPHVPPSFPLLCGDWVMPWDLRSDGRILNLMYSDSVGMSDNNILCDIRSELWHPWLGYLYSLSPFCPLHPVFIIVMGHNLLDLWLHLQRHWCEMCRDQLSLVTHPIPSPLLWAAHIVNSFWRLRKSYWKVCEERHQHTLLGDSGRWVVMQGWECWKRWHYVFVAATISGSSH